MKTPNSDIDVDSLQTDPDVEVHSQDGDRVQTEDVVSVEDEDIVDPQGDETNEPPTSPGVPRDVEQPGVSIQAKSVDSSAVVNDTNKQSKGPASLAKTATTKASMENTNAPPTPLVKKVCPNACL